jgi:hypothetical protein
MSQKWAPTCHNTKKYRDHNKNFSRGKAPQRARVVTDHQNTPINTPIRSERCPVKATTTATPPPPPTNRTIHLRLSRVGSIPRTLIAIVTATVTRTSERTPANPNGSIGEAKVASKTTVRAKSNAILFAESTRRVVRRLLEDTQKFYTHTHRHTHRHRHTGRKKGKRKERRLRALV